MRKLLLPILMLCSCGGIDQNQQEFNAWVKTAQKPIVVKWQNKLRGIQTDDDCLLIDSKNNVLFLHECGMALPDTIK